MDADEYLTLARESARTGIGGFRVPRFELTIDGVRPENSVLRDIVDITYRDNIDQIDGFELTVGNWDPARRRYKYIGSDDSKSAADATKPTAQASVNTATATGVSNPAGRCRPAVRGLAASMSRSTNRLNAMAALRAKTMQSKMPPN